MPISPLTNEIMIGDEFLSVGSGGTMEHRDPATNQINGVVTLGGSSEVVSAVAVAKAALKQWQEMGPRKRRDCLGRLADIVESWKDQFAALTAAENGMPQRSFAQRHDTAVEWIRTYQGFADKVGGELTVSSDSGRLEYVREEAYGVVGIIITWNSPLLSLTMKVPAALAAGNTVVIKPSELTPYTPLLFGRACLEAGIPPGVVNIVPGGAEAGEAVVLHRDVEKISFTGGMRAATRMMQTGAPLIKPFCFELGGKSAHVVFPDADLPLAAKVVVGGLSNAGQSCVFGSRVYVHEEAYAAFRAAVVEATAALVVGDPRDPRTTMGPLITAGARDRVVEFIRASVEKGHGKLIMGGSAPKLESPFNDGYFVEPTVFEAVDPDSPLAQEEIFGPVFSLFRFSDEEKVLEEVNATDFGLSNYVHTNDLRRAVRVASQMRSGMVFVNDATRNNPGAPFGGHRSSGIGYEGGRAGLEEYLRKKTIGLV